MSSFLMFPLCPVPPKITSEPKNVIAYEMDSVTFHCAALGKPEPTINWTRDGQNVGNGEYLNFTAQANMDGSSYKCTADNGIAQPAASATALLTVKALGMRQSIHDLCTYPIISKSYTMQTQNIKPPIIKQSY